MQLQPCCLKSSLRTSRISQPQSLLRDLGPVPVSQLNLALKAVVCKKKNDNPIIKHHEEKTKNSDVINKLLKIPKPSEDFIRKPYLATKQ